MMDSNWWKEAKGTHVKDPVSFQKMVQDFSDDTLVIVDFFMPQCIYCVKFLPEWNQIVDEYKAAYGDKIQFLKVDGTSDRYTASRYEIQSYPSFIALEPGSIGENWHHWKPMQRSYRTMKTWIGQLLKSYHIHALPKPSV